MAVPFRRIKNFSPTFLKLLSRFSFFPYTGAGIRVSKLSPNFMEFETTMKLRCYNKNPAGTHFGGSLYSMTDPLCVILLGAQIGETHYVWDKFAYIEFVKPSKSEVRANFKLSSTEVETIIKETRDGKPHYYTFYINVVDSDNEVVAKVKKEVYVRKKPHSKL